MSPGDILESPFVFLPFGIQGENPYNGVLAKLGELPILRLSLEHLNTVEVCEPLQHRIEPSL